jgi:outer membrane lipoprotein SlyB
VPEKAVNMNTQVNKPPCLLMRAAGIAAILFGVAGIMGCNMNSDPGNNAAPAKSSTYSSNPFKSKCTDCGQIESVQEIVTRGEGSGAGAVGGAVVGGAVGHQVGSGRGQDLATVAGAVGGAVAGNEIEKRVKSTKSYAITVRLDDGSSRVFYEASPPTWRPGDPVKVTNGTIQSNR